MEENLIFIFMCDLLLNFLISYNPVIYFNFKNVYITYIYICNNLHMHEYLCASHFQ